MAKKNIQKKLRKMFDQDENYQEINQRIESEKHLKKSKRLIFASVPVCLILIVIGVLYVNINNGNSAGLAPNPPIEHQNLPTDDGLHTDPGRSFLPGTFRQMNDEEIAEYLGRYPFSSNLYIPSGLFLQDIPRGIFEGEDVPLRGRFITYFYTDDTDMWNQSLEITLAKGMIPKLEGWYQGSPVTIGNVTVYWYRFGEERFNYAGRGVVIYNAFMLIDGIGYGVKTTNLSEADFWRVVNSIIE